MKEKRTFAQLQAENRRCATLRFLAEDADYAMNTSLLQSALEAVGHGVSRDCVNADVRNRGSFRVKILAGSSS